MSKRKVGLLGLGLMGSGMAGRLLAAGFDLSVYNRDPAKAEKLVAAGAKLAHHAREAAHEADVVISMVADDAAAKSVWHGTHGALHGVKHGAILIECSTVSVEWVHELAELAAKHKCDFLDAPVTGSRNQAASGELLFIVGGCDKVLEKARPVLAVMSRDIVHLGPTGSGALVKLINNFVCGVQAVALAEAIAMIERCDLDHAKALAVLTTGAPASPLVKAVAQRMTSKDYSPHFTLRLMLKDLAYAMHEARLRSMNLHMANCAHSAMLKALDAGHGGDDFSSVVETLRK